MIICFAWKTENRKRPKMVLRKVKIVKLTVYWIRHQTLKFNPEYLKLTILKMSRSGNVWIGNFFPFKSKIW